MTHLAYLVAGGLLTALFGYLGVIRRLSGRVKTSDASQLWTAMDDYRKDLTARNSDLTERIDRLEEQVRKLQAHNDELHAENGYLRKLVDAHEETIKTLKTENAVLKKRVGELEVANGTS